MFVPLHPMNHTIASDHSMYNSLFLLLGQNTFPCCSFVLKQWSKPSKKKLKRGEAYYISKVYEDHNSLLCKPQVIHTNCANSTHWLSGFVQQQIFVLNLVLYWLPGRYNQHYWINIYCNIDLLYIQTVFRWLQGIQFNNG